MPSPDVNLAINRHPLIISPDMLLIDAVALMSQQRCSYALTQDFDNNSNLMGIITERDIVKAAARGVVFNGTYVSEVMTSKLLKRLAPGQQIYRILIVEDSWEHRHLLRQLLTPLGFVVREAKNGEHGLELWHQWKPHLIFMDMQMPLIDGYQATRQIKASTQEQNTKIIALTASALEEEKVAVFSAGCDDFQSKPFQAEEVFDKLAKHLGVVYVEQSHNTTLNKAAPIVKLTILDLEVMSPQWRKAIYIAACECSDERILQLLQQIPAKYASLTSALRELVDNFHFDKIMELTANSV